MKWEGKRESENVEDRRGEGGFRFPFPRRGAGGFQFPFPPRGGGAPGRGGGIGIVGLLIIVGVMLLLGVDPRALLQDGGPPGGEAQLPRDAGPPSPQGGGTPLNDRDKSFVSVVLAKTEDVWTEQFAQMGRRYEKPKLVLFDGAMQSGCGTGLAQMGPFYCPLDQKVYLDLSFYRDLANRFRAPGDFAQAYVIAHEIGHHAQTLLGVTEKVMRLRSQMSEAESNALQVRMELQADCFAGLWANRADKLDVTLDPGDAEEALNAASAIGDDRIQRQTQGQVTPDSFTHGSSEQRVRWFKRGLMSGNIADCDTFSVSNP